MTEFENLKIRYISAVQLGLTVRASYHESKQVNEILHKFCESLIDISNYNDFDKAMMKHELGLLKESLSQEIEAYYNK